MIMQNGARRSVITAFAVGLSTLALMTGTANAANGSSTPTTGSTTHHTPAGPLKCGHFTGGGINIHSAPGVGTPIVGVGYRDDCLSYNRSVVNEWVTCPDGRSSIWWNITDEDTRVTGWVSDCYLTH
ncbi:hypothetical protein ACH4C2_30565 [Streptomyces sp. NPDC018057]|uniref:hypothetical protein n=1 Tax=unclassified Streptomyces TaxID=2593676 RepID=UPI00379DC544